MPSRQVLPDHVRDAKIETDFLDSCTRHVVYEAEPSPSSRSLRREERWQRESLLGRGTFGMVHLERCITGNDNKVRAVKEIMKGIIVGVEDDWIRELDAVFKFSHPKYRHCFVRSEGWYELNDRIFIIMKYMPLGDLQINLNDEPLSEFEGRQITEQVLEAVGFMHNSGFLHYDLKPSNIMVVSRAPAWHVRVADFGISMRLTDQNTVTVVHRGTLGYAAPEVIVSTDHPCSPADMWSLGCVVHKILTGTPPLPPSLIYFGSTPVCLSFRGITCFRAKSRIMGETLS
ncbi:kinase-like domain-containing protein [Fusarium solani]|uniref:mitogen-activated protein kinase n=1 Tax=Fusarium solani TaxID=169388 RepID=A0A9P9HYN6_FUSSL|nr:kinase-like domain-containing protein [Fusarium solani]KAH7266020.1 kinase-like domain-containing protein [Fusarium solani]